MYAGGEIMSGFILSQNQLSVKRFEGSKKSGNQGTSLINGPKMNKRAKENTRIKAERQRLALPAFLNWLFPIAAAFIFRRQGDDTMERFD